MNMVDILYKLRNKNDKKIAENEKQTIVDESYREKIHEIVECIKDSEAIVIGAGSGMSTSAGLTYGGDRFRTLFPEYIAKYGMKDMYSAGFYPFETQEEKWAYWSRHIYYNRYDLNAGKPYVDLLDIINNKEYFVITTNVDSQFTLAGFPKEKVFATQGDYGYLQCACACHKKIYYNESQVREMLVKQKNCKIPSYLVPKCPVCGGDMEVNLRCDEYFVEDKEWGILANRYEEFLNTHSNKKILFIELGTGMNTPGIIKFPFWKMTNSLNHAHYICINLNEAYAPKEISERSICIDEDIKKVLEDIRSEMRESL